VEDNAFSSIDFYFNNNLLNLTTNLLAKLF
jgi:hypothetical protein